MVLDEDIGVAKSKDAPLAVVGSLGVGCKSSLDDDEWGWLRRPGSSGVGDWSRRPSLSGFELLMISGCCSPRLGSATDVEPPETHDKSLATRTAYRAAPDNAESDVFTSVSELSSRLCDE